ncbi:WHG domain-containing protein [Streptomyces sp. NRRL S-1813]|uniref:WHG domain-containing protein n=1 Tax=Streptomyces sp. NRRL S-1813 TaxID=1463888 RepID=UPI00068B0A9D|nr:WHG domain-containing protein [Streptomyces sp. NRRL S-1813]
MLRYRAPEDITANTAITAEIMSTLLDTFAAASANTAETVWDAHLEEHRQWDGGHPAPTPALRRTPIFWTRLHGVRSLELASHFAGLGFDPAQLCVAD